MTPKERAAMQQALEALETCHDDKIEGRYYWPKAVNEAIAALREALAEQAEQEPVAWWDGKKMFNPINKSSMKCVTQEPIAWMYEAKFTKQVFLFRNNDILPNHKETALYAAPVRTKDLTDDEIQKIWEETISDYKFARAVIAADREKNK